MAESKKSSAKKAPAKKRAASRKASAPKAPKPDADIKVTLVDANEQTVHDVNILACSLGATVKSSSGHSVTVVVPVHDDSERHPGGTRERIVEGLVSSPLVNEVE